MEVLTAEGVRKRTAAAWRGPAAEDGDPHRMRQFDLRQFRDRCSGAGDRCRRQGRRRLDRLHRRAWRGRRIGPAAAGRTAVVHPGAVWRVRRLDRLCG
nr:hypothetical protein [Tanacetum cinerariifolium]